MGICGFVSASGWSIWDLLPQWRAKPDWRRGAASCIWNFVNRERVKPRETPAGWREEGTGSQGNRLRATVCGLAACSRLEFSILRQEKFRIYHRILHRDRTGAGIFLHKKISGKVWGCTIALAGLVLPALRRSPLPKGDILIFLCALVFSIHILVIDLFLAKAGFE